MKERGPEVVSVGVGVSNDMMWREDGGRNAYVLNHWSSARLVRSPMSRVEARWGG